MQKLTIEQLGQVIGGLDTEQPGLDSIGPEEMESANPEGEPAHLDELGVDEAATGEK